MRISDWSSDVCSSDLHDADLRRLEQAQELLLVLQLRAGRVAEGVARAAIALAEHGIEVAGVLVAEAETAPDPLVDILGQRPGHLDAEAVQVEGVLIADILEPRASHAGRQGEGRGGESGGSRGERRGGK